MPNTVSPNTVNASNSVCILGLATLSSTAAAPFGRSVTDSSRFILIIPQLLSRRDQPQLPFPELSRAYNPDRISCHRPLYVGRDQKLPRGFQTASTNIRQGRAVSIRHRPVESSEWPLRLRRLLLDRNPSFCALRAQGCRKPFQ